MIKVTEREGVFRITQSVSPGAGEEATRNLGLVIANKSGRFASHVTGLGCIGLSRSLPKAIDVLWKLHTLTESAYAPWERNEE